LRDRRESGHARFITWGLLPDSRIAVSILFDRPAVMAAISDKDPVAKEGIIPGDKIVDVNGIATPTWEKAEEVYAKVVREIFICSCEFTVMALLYTFMQKIESSALAQLSQ